ncbi:MAG: hypothetical protein R3F40_16050 [Candidatus Competibacteraceae bacterium]
MEVITDRPVDLSDPALISYGVGIAETLNDPERSFEAGGTYFPDYLPLLVGTLAFRGR